MSACPACGAHATERRDRGPLMTQADPPATYWRGRGLALTPRQHAIMHLLCRSGEASHLGLQLVGTGEDANPQAVKAAIFNLRRRLPEGVRIEAIEGWGYRLVIEGAA